MTTDEPDFAHRQGIAAARRVGAKVGLTAGDDYQTLYDAYRTTYAYQAPLVVRIADDMLADQRAEAGTDRVVALGRDGHSLAVAMRRLDPAFYRRHVSDVVVSRALTENALQDLERQGADFPLVHAFRRVASRVDPAHTVGGFRVLTEYLLSRGVPVGRPGSRVTVLDTSFKGTVQELLAAIYPETTFRGRYAFLGESPDDPHPGSKQGYEVHLRAGETRQGRPFYVLPADESKTFGHVLGINAVEELLDGPLTSPVRIDRYGPVQTAQRKQPDLLYGLSRGRISPRLRPLPVREGVKLVNLRAVADRAGYAAAVRDTGGNYRAGLEAGVQRFRSELRAWIRGGETDAGLQEQLDAFVHRSDFRHAERLGRALERARLPEQGTAAIWAGYDHCASDDDKRVFVQNVLNAIQTGGGTDGRGPRPGTGSGSGRGPDPGVARDGGDGRDPL
ncbi:ABC transporter permease [Kribbella italica]|uniref:Uncharacterized protein n=1 Tax=Kribbella italica TaxID=1540520 RepID=A0A7W9MT96_9ACTN|nr:ABC transporter permease [Kribbella italica]MBB5835424.1 hypothetical protein [Kribbella italica]